MPDPRPLVEVAVAVIEHADGRVLLAQRPPGKPMAGYWEFPGGKLEPGENVHQALVREIDEELGLKVLRSDPWITTPFVYAHAHVRLHYRRVRHWQGEPHGREMQAFRFERIDAASLEPWLPGALPLKRWLRLPPCYAISNAAALGPAEFLARLTRQVKAGRVRMLLVREPELDARSFAQLFQALLPVARQSGLSLVVSSRHDERYWRECSAVHLTARDLLALKGRPATRLCLASVHERAQIEHAARIGCDAVMLGTVRASASHPGGAVLGWEGFVTQAGDAPLPVYALGGMSADAASIDVAMAHGAHGVAVQRAMWD